MSTLQQYIAETQANLQELLPSRDFSAGSYNYTFFVLPWATNLFTREDKIQGLVDSHSIVAILSNPDSTDEEIDKALSNFNATRDQGSPSVGLISVRFSGTNVLTIPDTATITCGTLQFRPTKQFVGIVGEINFEDTDSITYTQATTVDNEHVFAIEVASVEIYSTVLGTGAVCSIDIESPNIVSLETASTFSSGILPESTESLLDKALLGMTSLGLSGKDNIRAALDASGLGVIGSAIVGMGDELMVRDVSPITGISKGGAADAYVLTSPAVEYAVVTLEATRDAGIWTLAVPEDVFAGAYDVVKVEGSDYSVGDTTTVLSYTPSSKPVVNSIEDARYSTYQKLSVTFVDDAGEPSDTTRTYITTIAYMPNISQIQDYVNDITRTSVSFDIVAKSIVPILVGADVSIIYPAGILPPDASVIQEAIATEISGKLPGTWRLYVSSIVTAVASVFPEGIVQMPTRLTGLSYLPDGTSSVTTSSSYLEPPVGVAGVARENTKYFCASGDVSVILTEDGSCAS